MGAKGECPSMMRAATEIHMQAGDALLFVDCCTHGSANRTNEGQRRVIVYRYGPSWGNFRHGYHPSPELLDRLTPERRRIVSPQTPIPARPQPAGAPDLLVQDQIYKRSPSSLIIDIPGYLLQ